MMNFHAPRNTYPPLTSTSDGSSEKPSMNASCPIAASIDEDWKDHHLIEPAFDKLMGEIGLQKGLFPLEYGGWGLAKSDYIFRFGYLACEELGRADTGMAVALGVTFWPLLVISVEPYVNERLLAEFAPMFCNTKKAVFAANAMTEPQGGADIENLGLLGGKTIRTTARLEGDEWVINGHKLWPTNSGGVSKLFGVPCTTKLGSSDPNGFCLYLCACRPAGCYPGRAL